jgi:hypothetical protein
MTLPTFFIIGAPKAGTTSLHQYLDQHPEIQMSAIKEPRFFAGPENGFPYPPDKVNTLAEYELLFDPAIAVRGESSTDYAAHPRREGAPERIKQMVPGGQFIYMVRDPIARSISHYKMAAALFGEQRSLADALREDLTESKSRYIAPSLYATQLDLYLRHFSQEQILVVDQDDLLKDRRSTLSEIFSFLSVEDEIDSSAFEEELLRSSEWRTYPDGYASFVGRVITPRVRWIPRGIRRSARRAVERTMWRPLDTTLEGGLRAELEALYAPEVERLRELTGKRFVSWTV